MPTFYVAQPLGYSIQTPEIDDDAVTYPKIQNISATDKVLGRETAGAGNVEEITCTAAGRALLDDANAAAQRTTLGLGDVALETAPLAVAKGGTALAALGAALTLLRTNSGATAAEWAAIEAAIRDAITGTGSQVLRRNAGNTALEFATVAAGGTEVKIATATWATTFTTTSSTMVDVTSATVTISGLTAGTTYTLIAFVEFHARKATAGQLGHFQLLVDGTASNIVRHQFPGASQDMELLFHSVKTSVTGATSYIAKLQAAVNSAETGVSLDINTLTLTQRITVIAIAN